jgi:hypothetical protein
VHPIPAFWGTLEPDRVEELDLAVRPTIWTVAVLDGLYVDRRGPWGWFLCRLLSAPRARIQTHSGEYESRLATQSAMPLEELRATAIERPDGAVQRLSTGQLSSTHRGHGWPQAHMGQRVLRADWPFERFGRTAACPNGSPRLNVATTLDSFGSCPPGSYCTHGTETQPAPRLGRSSCACRCRPLGRRCCGIVCRSAGWIPQGNCYRKKGNRPREGCRASHG